jgi:cytoskeletal protein RodZ
MYSGKESSPLGLGITAEPLVLGTIQEGRDKTNWIVTLKNGIKVWSRITRFSEIREKEEEKENIVQEEPAKKKAPPRKKTVANPKASSSNTEHTQDITEAENAKVEEESTKESVKRKPTNYNIYMKYKLKQLVKEETDLKPKERIAHAVALWQSMTTAEKEEIVNEAKIALENGDI